MNDLFFLTRDKPDSLLYLLARIPAGNLAVHRLRFQLADDIRGRHPALDGIVARPSNDLIQVAYAPDNLLSLQLQAQTPAPGRLWSAATVSEDEWASLPHPPADNIQLIYTAGLVIRWGSISTMLPRAVFQQEYTP